MCSNKRLLILEDKILTDQKKIHAKGKIEKKDKT